MKRYKQKKKLKRNNINEIRKTISQYLNQDISSPIIVIAGITGSGKSSLALKLCNEFNGFIINADSRQIYKQLKIGSAQPKPNKIISKENYSKYLSSTKPYTLTNLSATQDKTEFPKPQLHNTKNSSPNEANYKELPSKKDRTDSDTGFKNAIPSDCWIIDDIEHYLYGHVDIREKYTLYHYQKEVKEILEYKKIVNPKQTPFLVGGTGLYINAVIKNYNLKKEAFDPDQRKELESKSLKELQNLIPKDILIKLNNSDLNNPYRLIRIIEKDGKLYDRGNPMSYLALVIEPNSSERYEQQLKTRIDKMFAEGLLEENTKIRKKFKPKKNKTFPQALNAIGYEEFNNFFSGSISIEDVKDRILLHTKQYAKRQSTWFRNKL